MATTKPKTTTKRKATSVGVNKKKRGINKLQALAVAAVLAIVGVVVVVFSRADGTPNYQYSWNKYCVSAYGKTSDKEVQNCKNTSAEALVYRLYRGLKAKNPDDGGYKYWTQQFAGERTKATDSALVKERVAKFSSDTAFVKALYTNMLKREAKTKEISYWTAKLKATDKKKWSREKVVVNFASTVSVTNTSEAIRKNQTDFTAFLANPKTPVVAVVQNAAKDQRARFDSMLTEYQQPNKSILDKATALKTQTQALVNAANSTAKKSVVTEAELRAIGDNQAIAEANYAKAAEHRSDSAAKAAGANRLYLKAKDLADFATDIGGNSVYGISKIKDRNAKTKGYATDTAKVPDMIKDQIAKISSSYTAAQKKLPAPVVPEVNGTTVYKAPIASDCRDDAAFQNKPKIDRYIIRTKHTVNGQSVDVVGCGNRTNGGHVTVEYLKSPLCPGGYTPANIAVGKSSHYKYCYKN